MFCVYKFKDKFMLFELIFVALCYVHILESEATCKLMSSTAKEKELLEKLKPLNGHLFETKDAVDPNKFSYKINICEKVQGQSDGVGAVQYAGDKNFSLGRYDEVEVTGGYNWMLLKYFGGDAYDHHCNKSDRATQIMIICDPDVLAGNLEIIEERNASLVNCYYLFEVGSNVSCVPKPADVHKGRSSGTVFCILFFTAAFLYLGLGFIYKRYIAGAKGLEQIPNFSFWRDFGNLQADGCDFVCRCGSRQESHAYRGIDDRLDTEDERDEQLLN